ncbi:MAG: hypothetical protein UW24_C0003G0012 [Parcubacteria group bacterium GW2011_GWA2_44_12]|nr:MAG: hypothetical protein UW24_C0003G0012 [Parcubacteria group bacterium GW2011_GWA2_44_12]
MAFCEALEVISKAGVMNLDAIQEKSELRREPYF